MTVLKVKQIELGCTREAQDVEDILNRTRICTK
jgi:hypothetical protein